LVPVNGFQFRQEHASPVYNLIPVNDGTEQIKPNFDSSIASPIAIEQEQPLKTLDRMII